MLSAIIPIVRREPFDDPAWLFDLKLDGFRGLADRITGRMLSKNRNRHRSRLISLILPENERSKAVARRPGGEYEKTIPTPFHDGQAEIFAYRLSEGET
jgi:hypothetical protein